MTTLMEARRQLGRFTLKIPSSTSAGPVPRQRKQHAHRVALWILSALTVWSLAWLLYRWLLRPAWLSQLPSLLGELVFLVEAAGLLTLAFVWAGLGLRHLRRSQLSAEMISPEQLYSALSPKAFERYVAGLFRQKGYRVTVRGGSGDHGVDLELQNRLGRRAIVQCKRYQNTVGEEVVRELLGTMLHEGVTHAFLVTTADISESARIWAADKPITLIDGASLAQIATAIRQRSNENGAA
jgi:restriction system protein